MKRVRPRVVPSVSPVSVAFPGQHPMTQRPLQTALSLLLALVTAPRTTAADVSFRNDAMAVFSKSGCNAGACHGNKNGKGGFKLSLRGQDPDLDFLALTRDQLARRTNPLEPDQSLILLKATAQIPHEGGVRFT